MLFTAMKLAGVCVCVCVCVCVDRRQKQSEDEMHKNGLSINSVQSLSRVWLFETPWTTAHQALSITNS